MKLALIAIGGQKEAWLAEFSSAYEAKIGRFCDFEIIRLKPSKLERASSEAKRQAETAELLKALKKDDVVVLCDERGEAIDSRKFSGKLVKFFERGRPRVVVVIGGAYGFDEDLKKRADWIWSLSPMVLNHHLAQALVLEQIYRAFAIWKNLPYHND